MIMYYTLDLTIKRMKEGKLEHILMNTTTSKPEEPVVYDDDGEIIALAGTAYKPLIYR